MALTAEERVIYEERLTSAEGALHELMTGQISDRELEEGARGEPERLTRIRGLLVLE